MKGEFSILTSEKNKNKQQHLTTTSFNSISKITI